MNDLKRKYGVVHGMARCSDCGWETESYKNAQALAARHARAHGHRVSGEVGYAYEYRPARKPALGNGSK